MGADWFKMRPNTTDMDQLKQLVEAQALALRQWDRASDEQDTVDPDRVSNSDRLPTAQERGNDLLRANWAKQSESFFYGD